MADTNQLSTWLNTTNPDMVMMHFGSNDCWGNPRTAKIRDAYTKLVMQMRINNPNMIIVVAQIIPMHPNDLLDYEVIILDLNTAMPEPLEDVLKLDTVVSTWCTGCMMTMNITNTSNMPVSDWKLKVNKKE